MDNECGKCSVVISAFEGNVLPPLWVLAPGYEESLMERERPTGEPDSWAAMSLNKFGLRRAICSRRVIIL